MAARPPTAGESFNPRPREGATPDGEAWEAIIAVSIHAPVKGRPFLAWGGKVKQIVSIHAPVKGRLRKLVKQAVREGFNPRPREGATSAMLRFSKIYGVSIHAPVKGRRA